MAEVNLPAPLVSHTPALGSDVLANDEAITAQVNGNLDTTNVTTGSPVAIGASSNTGNASTLAVSNHTHAVQGFEQLGSDPGSPQVGQIWFNTGAAQVRGSVDGSTVKGLFPLGATDLPVHGSNHGTGQSDPLPAGGVDQTMIGQKTINAGTPGGDVAILNAWTDIITGVAITCGVAQTLQINFVCTIWNTGATTPNPGTSAAIFEVIAGVDTFVFGSQLEMLSNTGDPAPNGQGALPNMNLRKTISMGQRINVAAGTHTFKLKGYKADGNGNILAKQNQGVGGVTIPLTWMQVSVA